MNDINAQNPDLPYRELITSKESDYSGGAVLARFIDGPGFRFYWATEGLREQDYAYRPTAESRSTEETIIHIYSLATRMYTSAFPDEGLEDKSNLPMDELRIETLQLLKQSADEFRNADDLSLFTVPAGERNIPLWYVMNGPINDATWHCGQIASFRRISGNPMNPKVNQFFGTLRE